MADPANQNQSQWTQEVDPSNGRPYYYNAASGESSWVVPGEEVSRSYDNANPLPGGYWIDKAGNIYNLSAEEQ